MEEGAFFKTPVIGYFKDVQYFFECGSILIQFNL